MTETSIKSPIEEIWVDGYNIYLYVNCIDEESKEHYKAKLELNHYNKETAQKKRRELMKAFGITEIIPKIKTKTVKQIQLQKKEELWRCATCKVVLGIAKEGVDPTELFHRCKGEGKVVLSDLEIVPKEARDD